jgi:hypothetical protein
VDLVAHHVGDQAGLVRARPAQRRGSVCVLVLGHLHLPEPAKEFTSVACRR